MGAPIWAGKLPCTSPTLQVMNYPVQTADQGFKEITGFAHHPHKESEFVMVIARSRCVSY